MAKGRAKVRYEVDPHNRLIIAEVAKKSKVPKYRYLVDGRFRIGKKNSLIYHIKKSQDSNVPQQIKFSGDWSLDKNHDLILTLNKWGNQIAGNKLTIKGKLIDAKGNKLLFAAVTKTPDNRTHIYVLKLSGSWYADKYNRLSFDVEKEKGLYDGLILRGVWEVNKQGQLIYKYTKRNLRTKQEQTHILFFKGRWDIVDRFRLSYLLGRNNITITGRWKIDKRKGFLFEVEYEKDRIHTIAFSATLKLNKRNRLEVRLKSKRGEDLGIKLTLSQNLLKGYGEAFLKALASGKELALHAGIGFIW